VQAGSDTIAPGTVDYSASLTKLRNSSADGLVMCLVSADAVRLMKQFCAMGLSKTFRLVGIDLEDFSWQLLPCDQLAGSLFPVHWSPNVTDSAAKFARDMQPALKEPISWRHYFGYQSMAQLIDRIHGVGTTDTAKLVDAFQDQSFDAAKPNPAVWRACDHQCAQDEWVGTLVSNDKRAKTSMMFDLNGHIGPMSGAGACSNTDAAMAMKIISAQKIPARENYQAVRL
jgi:ABC-type branched-subunit amino acid transport system substrate-binding protein